MDSVVLHPHCIADAGRVPSIVMKILPHGVPDGSSCEKKKKIKKDLTIRIEWDIKG